MTTPIDRPPAWVADAVFYQIFPDRFATSKRVDKPHGLEPWDDPPTLHGYKGGDLLGIVEHLDHLTDMGITAVYLNPVFQSGSNHRYHTHDYYQVDPLLGGNDAFDELLGACHERGLRVILDGVFNHASRGFFQFHDILENGAGSPWRDWFHIHAWPLHPYSDGQPANYDAWWGLKALPKFNTDNPQVREFLMRIGEHWARKGIDGWRLDVPEEIRTPGFWEEFRTRVRAVNPDLYIVGEIWANAAEFVSDGTRFDATMNYQFTTAVIAYAAGRRVDPTMTLDNPWYDIMPPVDAAGFGDRIERLLASYPTHAHMANLNLLDSHDTARILTIASGDAASVILGLVLTLTFPGAPCIYYGTEIGMTGGRDPFSRGAFSWDPATWDHDTLAAVKDLIDIRKAHGALRGPHYRRVWPPPGEHGTMLYVFERRSDEDDDGAADEVLVAVNPGDATESLSLPLSDFPGHRLALLWGEAKVDHLDHHARVVVPARGAAIWAVT
jgi:glycosidase